MIFIYVYLSILCLKALLALCYAHFYPRPVDGKLRGSVTVCQAILSGDPDLDSTLESNLFSLPLASFIWLVDDADPPGIETAMALKARHPNRQITIELCGTAPEGVNPKLFKLETARSVVATDVFLVLDDDTRLTNPSLDALIDALESGDLSTGLPFYRDGSNRYEHLLAQFVNNNSALTYLPLLLFAPPVSINGMCYALRSDTLSAIGGFAPILRHLTDDLAVAERVQQSGRRIIQIPHPQEVATSLGNLRDYIAQMHRWYLFAVLLMRRQSAALNALIFSLYGLPSLLLIAAIGTAVARPSPRISAAILLTLAVRSLILCVLQWRLSGRIRHRPLFSVLSEILQPLHLAHALTIKTIRWRSRRYRVYDNDRFSPT
jgi:ceramide glucosyltransferase